MTYFNTLGLAETLLRAVEAEGYTTPTPIQKDVIPAIMAGRDVVGIAQTGTGKTASFVLPLLHRFEEARAQGEGALVPARSCRALILTPTRELAQQIADNIRRYSRFTKSSVAVVVGGVPAKGQIRSLAGGVDIVVATPGRLLDLHASGAVKLDRTAHVVLDEGDQMLDLGFMPAIRRIMAALPKTRQTVLMSATMPAPIRELARDFQKDPQEISIGAVSRPIDRIEQRVVRTGSVGKREMLTGLLGASDVTRAIVFTRTKRGADRVARFLGQAGLGAAAIHGNKSQGQRERALAAFRTGDAPILVATDIAARGIDVDDVSHVVNFDLPNVPETYVHRIGRTARAGREGIAISLCDPAETGLLKDIERLIGRTLDTMTGLAVAPPRQRVAPVATQKSSPQRAVPSKAAPQQAVNSIAEKARPKRQPSPQTDPVREVPAQVRERQPGPETPMAGLERMLGVGRPPRTAGVAA